MAIKLTKIILIIAFLFAAASPAFAEKIRFQYKSDWGDVNFVFDNKTGEATGSYGPQKHPIHGQLSEHSLKGNWQHSDSKKHGAFVFTFNKDFSEFKGKWNYSTDKKWRETWNGKLVKSEKEKTTQSTTSQAKGTVDEEFHEEEPEANPYDLYPEWRDTRQMDMQGLWVWDKKAEKKQIGRASNSESSITVKGNTWEYQSGDYVQKQTFYLAKEAIWDDDVCRGKDYSGEDKKKFEDLNGSVIVLNDEGMNMCFTIEKLKHDLLVYSFVGAKLNFHFYSKINR